MKRLILCLIVLCLFACNKDDNKPDNNSTTNTLRVPFQDQVLLLDSAGYTSGNTTWMTFGGNHRYKFDSNDTLYRIVISAADMGDAFKMGMYQWQPLATWKDTIYNGGSAFVLDLTGISPSPNPAINYYRSVFLYYNLNGGYRFYEQGSWFLLTEWWNDARVSPIPDFVF